MVLSFIDVRVLPFLIPLSNIIDAPLLIWLLSSLPSYIYVINQCDEWIVKDCVCVCANDRIPVLEPQLSGSLA